MSEYWEERLTRQLITLGDKTSKEISKRISKYYKQTMDKSISDFLDLYQELLDNAAAANGATTINDLYRLDKYYKVQADMRKNLRTLGNKQIKAIDKDLEVFYKAIFDKIPLETDKAFTVLSNEKVSQIINNIWCSDGKSWSQRVWDNTAALQSDLENGIVDCVIKGSKPTDLKQLLRERFGVSYSESDRLVRTETAHIQSQAAADRYKQAGIERYRILVEKDACDECKALEGKEFTLNDIVVPLHPNCRCCIVPILEGDNSQLSLF